MVQQRTRHWVAVVMLCTLVAACVTYQARRADRGIIFNHAKHPAQDMACEDCHATDAGEPAMPSHDTCGVCHEAQVDVANPKECKLCHSDPEQAVKPRTRILSDEIIFMHGKHSGNSVECKACHTGADPTSAIVKPLMQVCMDCHGKTRTELNECSVCHKEMSRSVKPKYHGAARIPHDAPDIWESLHGQQSRNDPKFCEICHEEQSFCEECHRKNPPKSHTLAWRKKSHGMRAEWERDKCAVCHEEDSCLRCHKNTSPESHRAGWGSPGNRHCITCHYPVREDNCAVCHETVEHKAALPSPHDLGIYPARCTPCHPFNNPYRAPHLLNSTARCTVCH